MGGQKNQRKTLLLRAQCKKGFKYVLINFTNMKMFSNVIIIVLIFFFDNKKKS